MVLLLKIKGNVVNMISKILDHDSVYADLK